MKQEDQYKYNFFNFPQDGSSSLEARGVRAIYWPHKIVQVCFLPLYYIIVSRPWTSEALIAGCIDND